MEEFTGIYLKDEHKRVIFLLWEWIFVSQNKISSDRQLICGLVKLFLSSDRSEGIMFCKAMPGNGKF